MKKFISMVMAAAMVVSLVPATAFAYTGDVTGTAKVVEAASLTKDEAKNAIAQKDAPELQIKITDVDYYRTQGDSAPEVDLTITLDNAEFVTPVTTDIVDIVKATGSKAQVKGVVLEDEEDKDEITVTIAGELAEDDVIYVDLYTKLTKTAVGTKATVSVDSDIVDVEDLVFAEVVEKALDVTAKKTVDIAPEEEAEISTKGIVIKPVGGATIGDEVEKGDVIKLKLNKGFEFAKKEFTVEYTGGDNDKGSLKFEYPSKYVKFDDDVIELTVGDYEATATELKITGLWIEATTAKAGDVAEITVKGTGVDAVKVAVAEVVESGLVMSVDEDEDVPAMWSGVDQHNSGLTADEDEHWSLEVTVEETFKGAHNDKDEIEFAITDGVYVTEVDVVTPDEAFGATYAKFEEAYKEGDHKGFVFEKRAFNETTNGTAAEFSFKLELVADPGFVGDVELTMLVDGEEVGTVVIAKFETPMFVEAAQNDLIIDYRNTEVPTAVVLKEAEAGLWAEGLQFVFGVDDNAAAEIAFEDDATITVDEASEMEIKEVGEMGLKVKECSDDEAAVITIDGIELYMSRNIPAGAYDLEMGYVAANGATYGKIGLFAPDEDCVDKDGDHTKECIIDDVSDYSKVVKEGWINVVTAGRDADDASFTTKVVVPVGESYIVAGEQTVALDVPAYVSASGYTMLPVRAVAVALGILNNNVLWDQASKTVTILYGQRIITMTVGAKVINVNGSAIPASASVEVVDGRTFLPMRDLATALGVTDITWDAATKTATLNGNK